MKGEWQLLVADSLRVYHCTSFIRRNKVKGWITIFEGWKRKAERSDWTEKPNMSLLMVIDTLICNLWVEANLTKCCHRQLSSSMNEYMNELACFERERAFSKRIVQHKPILGREIFFVDARSISRHHNNSLSFQHELANNDHMLLVSLSWYT